NGGRSPLRFRCCGNGSSERPTNPCRAMRSRPADLVQRLASSPLLRWRPEHTLERWAQAVHPPWVKKLVPERALKALRNAFPVGRKKTPFIMQMEAVECGAAALAIVLGYYGRFVPLAQLRGDGGVSRAGSKASSILKAARKHGLVAKGYSKGLNKLEEVRLPAIVFWEFNHFIVLEGFSEDYVFVNDPAYGHRRIP